MVFLAGSTRRRPVLPCPVLPRRPSVRRPDPTGPKCVRFLDSTGWTLIWLLWYRSGWATFALNHNWLKQSRLAATG